MVLMVSAMLVLLQSDAEEAFKTLEQKVGKAATVVLKGKGRQQVSRNGTSLSDAEYSAELLMKAPSRARYRLAPGKQEVLLASDGTTLLAGGSGLARRRPAPGDLRARFLDPSITRVGLAGVVAIPTGYAGKDVEDRRDSFTCTDFTSLDPEDGLRRIRFTVKVSPSGRTYEATLSLDPRTALPRRRILVGRDEHVTTVVTETYQSWDLGGDLPDAVFELPASD